MDGPIPGRMDAVTALFAMVLHSTFSLASNEISRKILFLSWCPLTRSSLNCAVDHLFSSCRALFTSVLLLASGISCISCQRWSAHLCCRMTSWCSPCLPSPVCGSTPLRSVKRLRMQACRTFPLYSYQLRLAILRAIPS